MIKIYGLLILVFVAITFFFHVMRRHRSKKRLDQLKRNWGKVPDRRLSITDIRLFYDLLESDQPEGCYRVDEETFNDLDLDEVLALIDRTSTPVGAQYLYHLLRHPVSDPAILNEREQLIVQFSTNQSLREQVQMSLEGLERTGAKRLSHLLWSPLPEKPTWAKYIPILSLIAMVVLGLALFNVIHYGWPIVIFSFNFFTRTYVKRQIEAFLQSFEHLAELIRCASGISELKFEEINEIQDILNDNLRKTRRIEKTIFAIHYEDQFAITDYINSYFQWDIAGFYSALNMVERHLGKLRRLYTTVGKLDSLIAISSFRHEYSECCRPSFESGSMKFEVDNIYNPLVKDPVPNSFKFKTPDYIVTGSNMAGKTTFIKTLGVNAVLAQTINTCLASKYESPIIRVMSSIGAEDSLLEGKSYFMAEIESIYRLIKASESKVVHLLILDEIFRGTNSVERHAISIEVLNYLANKKDFVLVATHDMRLSEELKYRYQDIHFEEKVDESGLTFDYVIRPGPSITRNAIALLKQFGYPDPIIQKATGRITE